MKHLNLLQIIHSIKFFSECCRGDIVQKVDSELITGETPVLLSSSTTIPTTTTTTTITTTRTIATEKDFGIFFAGGWTKDYYESKNESYKYSGLYVPSTKRYCDLRVLAPYLYVSYAMIGLTACGTFRGRTWDNKYKSYHCSTFDVDKGDWETHYNISFDGIYNPILWKTSRELLLMGGHKSNTTTLVENGKSKKDFDLVSQISQSTHCGIEDPSDSSIIVTGRDGVVRYGEKGFKEFLPNMTYKRYGFGCGGYYNDANQLVIL